MKKKGRMIATSIATVAMCASLIAGGTYALFTSESTVNVAVTSGTVNVQATAGDLTLYSKNAQREGSTFEVGGTATKEGNTITIERMVPMDRVNFDIVIQNYSDVSVQYRTVIKSVEDTGLFSALTVTFTENEESQVFAGGYSYADWAMLAPADNDPTTGEEVTTINVDIAFPDGEDQNKYQGTSCKLAVVVEAVQGNAEVVNPVDYDEEKNIYYVNSEEGMMLMNGIINSTSHGEGHSLHFALTDDMDMTGYAWTPLRMHWVDLDGQSHTVSNVVAGIDDWGRSGFAGYAGGTTIKDLTLKNVTSKGSQAGIVAGATEYCTLSNVTIEGQNSATYDRSANPAEGWSGVGAVAGISRLKADSSVTIATGATINVYYNGLITENTFANEYGFIGDISAYVTKNGTIVTEGEWYQAVSDNAGLKAAIEAGQTTIYLADGDDYDLQGIQSNGLTLIGLGDEVYVANTTNFAGNGSIGAIWRAINLQNVTITNTVYTMDEGGKATFTNVTFAKGFRQGYGSNVTFTDCKFGSNSEDYALHFQTDNGSEGGKIALTGCEFLGGKVHLGGPRTYVFSGCDFAEGTDFQVWSGITLSGCTVNGVAVTAENVKTLFPNLNLEKVTWQ